MRWTWPSSPPRRARLWCRARCRQPCSQEIREQAAEPQPFLSPREQEIITLVARGESTAAIGAELHLSPATVKTYLSRAYEKLKVSDRSAAVAEAFRRGLIE